MMAFCGMLREERKVVMYPKEYFRTLFDLNRDLSQLFFKEFFDSFQFEDSLNHTHIKALMFIKFNEPCSMSTISAKVALEKGSFTTVSHHLIQSGYIEKQRDQEDKRISLLRLTEKGNKFTDEFADQHLEYVKRVIGVLDEPLQTRYLDLVEQLIGLNNQIKSKLSTSKTSKC
ncbi:MAG: MarR family winged helix-turn-helix transcriptional regulator [Sphaerochaetaceae bacterium]